MNYLLGNWLLPFNIAKMRPYVQRIHFSGIVGWRWAIPSRKVLASRRFISDLVGADPWYLAVDERLGDPFL